MTTITRCLGILAAMALVALVSADTLYSGTWNVTGQDAGTLTLRISGDRVSGAVVDSKDRKRTGHMEGSMTGKRFDVTLRLTDGTVREFQGNVTYNGDEAHMDGLLYNGNKPVGDVRFTVDTTSIASESGFFRNSYVP